MADINAGKIIRFPEGTTVTITPAGGSAVTLKNIVPGSFRWKPNAYAMLDPDMDRGELLADIREGDMEPGELDLDTKHTVDAGTTELYEELIAASDDGYMPSFTIVIDIPNDRNASTGVRYTATKAVRREIPEIREGAQFDTLNARFLFTSGSKAAYS